MASEASIDEVRPAIEDRLGGEAHLTTALPGMLEVCPDPDRCPHAVPGVRPHPQSMCTPGAMLACCYSACDPQRASVCSSILRG